MRCVVAGQVPLQVVKTKLTSTTLPRTSDRRNRLPSCVVRVKSRGVWITPSRGCSAQGASRKGAKSAKEDRKKRKRGYGQGERRATSFIFCSFALFAPLREALLRSIQ